MALNLPAGWSYDETTGVLTVPDGTTSVSGFSKNTEITKIIIPEGITTIENGAFSKCSSLEKVTLPESLTFIDKYAFNGCISLKEINIPEGVTTIGDQVFYSCSSLIEIIIPDGITSIGSGVFCGCAALEKVTLPESLTSIGTNAFSECTALEEIVIPEGVTSIGNTTFSKCSSLKELIIPGGVTSIGVLAFSSCTSLTDIYFNNTRAQWDAANPKNNALVPSTTIVHCIDDADVDQWYNEKFGKSDKEETEMPDNNNALIHFTEQQVQNLVTMVFNSVNIRIAERIVQQFITGDTKHVPSVDAVKQLIDVSMDSVAREMKAVEDRISGTISKSESDSTEYTDQQIQALREMILGINNWTITTVTGPLPEELAEKTIYLQRDSEDDKTWEMNILADGHAVNIGNTSIDLENYWSKDNIDGIVNALFGSELFGTKIGQLMSTTLNTYTEGTLDNRYWKKDELVDMVAEITSSSTFVQEILAAISKDLDDTYVQITNLKEYLGITGDLTVESVEAAIQAIAAKNEVQLTPISDEKIQSIVAEAFASTAVDFENPT